MRIDGESPARRITGPLVRKEPFGAGEQGGEKGLGKDPRGDTSRKGQTTLLLLDGRVSGQTCARGWVAGVAPGVVCSLLRWKPQTGAGRF